VLYVGRENGKLLIQWTRTWKRYTTEVNVHSCITHCGSARPYHRQNTLRTKSDPILTVLPPSQRNMLLSRIVLKTASEYKMSTRILYILHLEKFKNQKQKQEKRKSHSHLITSKRLGQDFPFCVYHSFSCSKLAISLLLEVFGAAFFIPAVSTPPWLHVLYR